MNRLPAEVRMQIAMFVVTQILAVERFRRRYRRVVQRLRRHVLI